jgi:hypothetical protein
MYDKITKEIAKRKAENDAILAAANAKAEADKAAEDKRKFEEASKVLDAQKKLLEASGVKDAKALVEGYIDGIMDVQVGEEDFEEDSDQDAVDSSEELETNADIHEEDEFDDLSHHEQQQLAQKDRYSGHLHATTIRVDPPLLDEGKKSIAAAEKELEECKVDYDKKHFKAQEKELAFHAASRVSIAAREERAKAEDRFYIASKAARKAMRLAENLQREARLAAAKQAAADKYAEVISSGNKDAS